MTIDLNGYVLPSYTWKPLELDGALIADAASQKVAAAEFGNPPDSCPTDVSWLIILKNIIQTLFLLVVTVALSKIFEHKLTSIAAFVKGVLTSASRNWRAVVVYVTTLIFVGFLIWALETGVMELFVAALITVGRKENKFMQPAYSN